jgi:hypothetical protein
MKIAIIYVILLKGEIYMKRTPVILTIVFTMVLCSTLYAGTTGSKKKTFKRVPYTEFKRIDKKFGKLTKHFEESLFKITEKGLYGVEVLLFEGNLNVGINNFDIVIHDSKDHDVGGAELKVISRMPEEGNIAEAKVKGSIPGLYSIDELDITTSGHWELVILIKKDGNEDSTVFDFPNVQ